MRRRANVAIVLAAGIAAALAMPFAAGVAWDGTAATTASTSDLPIAAQYAISAAVGADDSTYHATGSEPGVVLANAAHGVRVAFGEDGVTLSGEAFVWPIGLRSWGYRGARRSVEGAVSVVCDNRVEIDHGGLIEWYVNGPFGIQQGFTVADALEGCSGGPLGLELAVPDGLVGVLGSDACGLTWCDVDGAPVIRYGGLIAFDACGVSLEAWLEVDEEGLWIFVDDADAVYPLTIDPWVQQAKLTATDGEATDLFGHSVTISGDTVVIGAPYDDVGSNDNQGSAYVFEKPTGGWTTGTEAARLTASDGAADDRFGESVAISGNTVVVGSREDDTGSNTAQGSAYVFEKPVGGWTTGTETAKLTASDGATGDRLGVSVAIDGDTVVVGASDDDVGSHADQGSAYVFEKPAGGWTTGTETAKLTASDGAANDSFGESVAISGDTLVVGAYLDVIGSNSDQGSAYVFERPVGGWTTGTEAAKLTASDGAAEDHFGLPVAISGDTVVVGSFADDVGSNENQGSAYVFEKPAGAWATGTETAKLTASDGAADDYFGISVAVSGDMLVVGAYAADVGSNDDQGSAYVFEKPAGSWTTGTETAKLTASDGAAEDYFGNSVAISGGTVVVGVRLDDIGSNDKQGSACVFTTTDASLVTGDINGDGSIDLLDVRLCGQIAGGHIAGASWQLTAADVDGDGVVDETDTEILAEYVLGVRETLP